MREREEEENKYLDAYGNFVRDDNTEVLLFFDTSVFRHTNNYLIKMSNLEIFLPRSACKQIGKTVRKCDYVTGGGTNNL